MRVLGLLLITSLLIASCDDETVLPPDPVDIGAHDVLVLNEGNFQRGNASLGVYSPVSNTYSKQVFKSEVGYPIGDVLQSVSVVNGEYWLVINNSGKIVVLDSATLTFKHEITGFTSPRYVQSTNNDSKVFVSDLYADELYVVDPKNYAITNHISLNGWTDQMAMVASHLWVANREHPYVYVVDVDKEQVVDSIEIGDNPNTLLQLHGVNVAVLCEGKLNSGAPAEIHLIDPKARASFKVITLDAAIKPLHLRQDPETGNLYCIDRGIHFIDLVDYTYREKVVDLPDANLYGFDIDRNTGNIYVSDAKDFVQRSEVLVYNKKFELQRSFTAGVITGAFEFR
ncbi:MAG: hypothetical protein JJ975_08360 [Bacteroidia bacterium]|nr:hypothetical protein [Bacteroidia bacterium]